MSSTPPPPPEAGSLFEVDPQKPGIAAATLIVFGAGDSGADPNLLFVERTAAMRFAPGAVVFPGGRVDAADVLLGRRLSPQLDADDAGARVAAIRETIEETGLAVAVASARDAVREDWREALAGGEPFASVLAREGADLDLSRLTPFARWDPRFREKRAFDTRFYVASLEGAGDMVSPDGTEAASAFWTPAATMLSAISDGRHDAIFPTLRNLERLAQYRSHEDAVADAAARAMTTITPWIERDDQGEWLCIARGQGYPVTRVALGAVRRG